MAGESLSEQIVADDYVRERLGPRFGDPLYLVLSDLRSALELVRTDKPVRVLDYGCGGSPYRSLFPNARYLRADYLQSPGLDYILQEDSTVDEKSETFDVILSTQVLEHVRNPTIYLNEAYRLLKPGGIFVCSTHGTYEEHGCPFDFHRWTADGLRDECTKVGFSIERVLKSTTGPRAVLFLLELYRNRFNGLPQEPFGNAFREILGVIDSQEGAFHEWCDAVFPDFRVTESMAWEHALYICLCVIGLKPAESRVKRGFSFVRHSVLPQVSDVMTNTSATAQGPNLCPITGSEGELIQTRTPENLVAAYENYLGAALPATIAEKYFREPISEYQSQESGLRWYTPGLPGESDYYETLGRIYPWYYRDESWDKDRVCEILRDLGARSFVDYGCGNGALLRQAARLGIAGWGVDINVESVRACRAEGLQVYLPDEIPADFPKRSVLTLLQTIEHVKDPVQFLREILARTAAETLILSAPTHESLLGHARDPLSWPPHHFSMWSERAFRSLGEKIGYRVIRCISEPLQLERLEGMLEMEKSRQLRGLPFIPPGPAGASLVLDAQQRGEKWAMYSHSIVAVLAK